jgi:Protein of unknown function (DUF3822)
LKTLFTIGREQEESDVLLLELGQDHCCLAYLNEESKTFHHIRYILLDELDLEQNLRQILEEINTNGIRRQLVCSTFAEALLLPQRFAGSGPVLLDVVYDHLSTAYLQDQLPDWEMATSYTMPANLQEIIRSKFPGVGFCHAYTSIMKTEGGFQDSGQIVVHFTTSYFRVLVRRIGMVQLAETYAYKTPLDVVYYLLKICSEFGMEQSSATLILSGLVDPDSALFQELHNYFLNLNFAPEPSFVLPPTEHPHYYFTSLYNLATCAL